MGLPLAKSVSSDDHMVQLQFPSDDMLDGNLKLGSDGSLMRAFVLPDGVYWPYFDVAKQLEARIVLPNVVFERCTVLEQELINITLETLLTDRENVLIFGNPGIGKTVGMHIILMRLIDKIRAGETSISTIIVRMPNFSFRVTHTNNPTKDETPTCKHLCDCNFEVEYIETSQRVENWQSEEGPGQTVVLAELNESEKDAYFDGTVNGVVSMSLREIRDDAKTLFKEGATPLLAVPHTPQEIEAISRIMYRLINNNTQAMEGVLGKQHAVSTEEEFANIINERVRIAGPLMRIVFTFRSYEERYVKIHDIEADAFWKALSYTSPVRLPEGMSNRIGCYRRVDAQTPKFRLANCEMKAHTSYLACQILDMVKNKHNHQLLKVRFSGLLHQSQESSMLANGVLNDRVARKALRSRLK